MCATPQALRFNFVVNKTTVASSAKADAYAFLSSKSLERGVGQETQVEELWVSAESRSTNSVPDSRIDSNTTICLQAPCLHIRRRGRLINLNSG